MSKDDKAAAETAGDDPRPQTQVEGEQLSAEADAADPRLQGSAWLPGQGETAGAVKADAETRDDKEARDG